MRFGGDGLHKMPARLVVLREADICKSEERTEKCKSGVASKVRRRVDRVKGGRQ
jgi:hypothetical protein